MSNDNSSVSSGGGGGLGGGAYGLGGIGGLGGLGSNPARAGGGNGGGGGLSLPMNYNGILAGGAQSSSSGGPSPMTGLPIGGGGLGLGGGINIGGGGALSSSSSSGGSSRLLPLSSSGGSSSSSDIGSGGSDVVVGGGGGGNGNGGGGQRQHLAHHQFASVGSLGGVGLGAGGGGMMMGGNNNGNNGAIGVSSGGIASASSLSMTSGLVIGGGSAGGSGIDPPRPPSASAIGMSSSPPNGGGGGGGNGGGSVDELHVLVLQLVSHDQREGALLELSKKRESFPDLAPILWHTVGTVAALLQEIVAIYPLLTPPTLTAHASNRVCNALALLQCVASHPDTRGLFLNAHVPLYLYPFLNTQSKSRPFEYLRLTSLGVIGALVKMDDADVINFLLQTEIIPLCLRIMEAGSELSKTVATFIVQKILLDDVGLGYVCATAERFYAVSTVLNNMVGMLVMSPSVRLLKHIVRCYLRLSDNTRARDALRQALPTSLRDDTFSMALRDDMTVKKWLSQLLNTVGPPDQSLPQGAQASGGMMGSSRLASVAGVMGMGGGLMVGGGGMGGGDGVELQ